MSTRSTCRACNADVIWATAPSGARLTLDKNRDPTGTSLYAVTKAPDLNLYVRILQPGEQPRPGVEHRHQAHRDTCTARQRQGPGDD